MRDAYAKCVFFICFFFAASFLSAESQLEWPTFVQEAVSFLSKNMSDEDKDYIRYTPRSDLSKLHFSFGLEIRNSFGLLGDNKDLLKSAGSENMHPDDASMVIVDALWLELRSRMDHGFRTNLEETEKIVKRISIQPFKYCNIPLFEIIKDLNDRVGKIGLEKKLTIRLALKKVNQF